MTDVAAEAAPPAAGRSLWADAWRRLKSNKAAVASAVYLVLMSVACLVGPLFTGHAFTTIYQDYVRVPPSLSSYPRADEIETALTDALARARVDLKAWEQEGSRVHITVTSARGEVDPRVTRYLDRSSTFENAEVEETHADGSLTMGADIRRLRFFFGTDKWDPLESTCRHASLSIL